MSEPYSNAWHSRSPQRATSNDDYGKYNYEWQRGYLTQLPNNIKNRQLDHFRQNLGSSNEEYGHFWLKQPKDGILPQKAWTRKELRERQQRTTANFLSQAPPYEIQKFTEHKPTVEYPYASQPEPKPTVDYNNPYASQEAALKEPESMADYRAYVRSDDRGSHGNQVQSQALKAPGYTTLPPIKEASVNLVARDPGAAMQISDIKEIELVLRLADSSIVTMLAMPFKLKTN